MPKRNTFGHASVLCFHLLAACEASSPASLPDELKEKASDGCSKETFNDLALFQSRLVGVSATREEAVLGILEMARKLSALHSSNVNCSYVAEVQSSAGRASPITFSRTYTATVSSTEICVNYMSPSAPDDAKYWSVYPWHLQDTIDMSGKARQIRVFDDVCLLRNIN